LDRTGVEDLEAIQVYIAKDSNFYARQFIERIFDAAKKLGTFPEIGRKKNRRQRIYLSRLLYYLFFQPESISIIAVIHGHQDLAGIGDKPWQIN